MRITFDLDSVIFDLKPIYIEAFKMAGEEYVKPTSWNIEEIYSPKVCENLRSLWSDDFLYTMPVLDTKIPYILNNLMQRQDMEVLFVTERRLKQPEKTYLQLRNAGIDCDFSQVYDRYGYKSEILSQLKPAYHFDDSPYVVKGCLDKGVNVVMISNNSTLYNHHLRGRVQYYKSLREALYRKQIWQPQIIK